MPYSSHNNLLFQENPALKDKDHLHKPYGFTRSVEAYHNAAAREISLLLANRALLRRQGGDYHWAITINVETDLTPEQIKKSWQLAALRMKRAGVVAYWVREPSRSNRCHYHLVCTSDHTARALKRIVSGAKPRGQTWHTRIEPIENPFCWVRYILKSKAIGERNGRIVQDLYAEKRLLFRPNLGIDKVGYFGGFWVKPKQGMWKAIASNEKKIADGLKRKGVPKLLGYLLNDFFGGQIPEKELKRLLGTNAGQKWVKEWANKLPKDE
jgi:hypothetical protein